MLATIKNMALVLAMIMLIPASYSFADLSLGEMKVKNEVVVTLSDGSVVELKNEKYPIYDQAVIDTLDDGEATLEVEGGRYVIIKESVYKVEHIGDGNTGLSMMEGDEGEACYCFETNAPYKIDTPTADTVTHAETTKQANYTYYAQGRSNTTEGITASFQIESKSDFVAPTGTTVLEPGDALASPMVQDPYERFESKNGCCKPAIAPILIPLTAGAAAVTGGVVGATTGNSGGSSDDPVSPVTNSQ